jgi:hypothetical protein
MSSKKIKKSLNSNKYPKKREKKVSTQNNPTAGGGCCRKLY